MYSVLPKLTCEISYRSIALQKIKLAFRLATGVEYCNANTVFTYLKGLVPGYIHEMFQPLFRNYSTDSIEHTSAQNKCRAKSLSFLGPEL